MRVVGRALLFAATLLALPAAPALALSNCGSLNQPACVEAPPPGVALTLSASQNPYGLAPLTALPSPDAPLWPKVRGHKPYGFNAVAYGVKGTTAADEASLHRQVGASMTRLGVDWSAIQYYPNSGAGGQPWTYSTLDARYKAFVAQGVRPLLSIMRTPRRFTVAADTRANSSTIGCGTSDGCWYPPRADALDELELFMRDLVKRYPLAAGIELWNEPNLTNPFWGGQPADPEHYAAMLAAVRRAVNAVRPALPLLGGALMPQDANALDPWGHERMQMREFLRRVLQAGGADSMDAVSYHPYLGSYPTWAASEQQANDFYWYVVTSAATEIERAYRDAGLPITERLVPTEFGASTTMGYTEAKQSEWVSYQFLLWSIEYAGVPLSNRVDGAFAHAPIEIATEPADAVGYGWTKATTTAGRYRPKPIYCEFRTRYGGFTNCPNPIRTR